MAANPPPPGFPHGRTHDTHAEALHAKLEHSRYSHEPLTAPLPEGAHVEWRDAHAAGGIARGTIRS
jgi:hypothetical protein